MVEDTHDGQFLDALADRRRRGPPERRAGRVRHVHLRAVSEQSLRVREAADAAMRKIAEHRGLGRFMGLTETRGVYAAHPLGGVPDGRRPELGAADADGAVFGYEGLYCFGSSIIPTSLGRQPVADDRGRRRALRRRSSCARGRLRPAGAAGGLRARGTPAEIVGRSRAAFSTRLTSTGCAIGHPDRRRRLPRAQRGHPRGRAQGRRSTATSSSASSYGWAGVLSGEGRELDHGEHERDPAARRHDPRHLADEPVQGRRPGRRRRARRHAKRRASTR